MWALGSFFIVLVQAENGFEGFMTIEANIIVDGHENLPWGILSENCTPCRDRAETGISCAANREIGTQGGDASTAKE